MKIMRETMTEEEGENYKMKGRKLGRMNSA
jgi:hypothetical protein